MCNNRTYVTTPTRAKVQDDAPCSVDSKVQSPVCGQWIWIIGTDRSQKLDWSGCLLGRMSMIMLISLKNSASGSQKSPDRNQEKGRRMLSLSSSLHSESLEPGGLWAVSM